MLTNQDEIRERIIQIRKERGLSQNQLAKDFGISRTHYCNVENGKKPVTESFLKVLASGYKIPMEAFIPNENGDLMQYCECTNDFVNAIIMTISILLKYANTTLTNMNSLITVFSPICMISAIRLNMNFFRKPIYRIPSILQPDLLM